MLGDNIYNVKCVSNLNQSTKHELIAMKTNLKNDSKLVLHTTTELERLILSSRNETERNRLLACSAEHDMGDILTWLQVHSVVPS